MKYVRRPEMTGDPLFASSRDGWRDGWDPRPRAHLAPVIVSGNAAVALLSEKSPLASLEFAEVLATSDLPGGVANLISGRKEELVPHLARHMDVHAIADAGRDAALSRVIGEDAAVNVKRVKRYVIADYFAGDAQGLDFIEAFTEIKTTWHPIGV